MQPAHPLNPTQRPEMAGRTFTREFQAEVLLIRAAFKGWSGPLELVDTGGRQKEIAEREAMLAAVLRLHAIGRSRVCTEEGRMVRAFDVERVLSCFRRLSLIAQVKPLDIAAYCEREAADDDNLLAHKADPLQLRYVLTFHKPETAGHFSGKIEALKRVCERADQAGMRAWFEEIGANKAQLPKETCQFLRLALLRLWNRRMGDMETLAFELAVLEVRQFEAMGWENTRMFCALLRRIGGGNLPAFGAYLTSDDIQEALELHQAFGNIEQCAHFRALGTVHDPKLVGELEKAVFATAAHFDAAAVAPAPIDDSGSGSPHVDAPRQKPSRLRRLFGFSGHAA